MRKKHEIQRLTALYLLKSGQAKDRVQVAEPLGVDRMSVGHWLSAYETGYLRNSLSAGMPPEAFRSSPKNSRNTYRVNFRSRKVFRVMLRFKRILLMPLASR